MRSQDRFRTLKNAARAGLGALLLLMAALPAQAQFATGGTGLHRNRVFWVDWGNAGENVFAGKTITRGFNIGVPATAANRLDITCTLSNAASTRGTAGLGVYTPGNWQGDGLDELYNIGGNQPGTGTNPNTLRVGLVTNSSSTVEFDFSCGATLGGQPFQLSGLVFADAEASGGSEFVAARLTSGGTVRVIDQIAQCRGGDTNVRSTVTVTTVSGFQQVQFSGPTSAASCETNTTPSLRAGPALVGYIDGATSARVIAFGGGRSAVAVGAVLDLEFSEQIPSSYGTAAVHVLNANWGGGVAVSNGDFNNPTNLATIVPGPRLGPTAASDIQEEPLGNSDVDALPKTSGPGGVGYANVASPSGVPGATYTISNVICNGPGSVAGWVDFDGNGVFDADERSQTVSCPAGTNATVDLTWTLPADYQVQQTSYMRLRLAPNPNDIAQPTGLAVDGEAEDYRIALGADADLQITKTNTPANGPEDGGSDTVTAGSSVDYSIVVTNLGPAAADGAIVRDPAATGLSCINAVCGSATNGAACPSATGADLVTALQSSGGVSIPTLPANGSVTLTLTCQVTSP